MKKIQAYKVGNSVYEDKQEAIKEELRVVFHDTVSDLYRFTDKELVDYNVVITWIDYNVDAIEAYLSFAGSCLNEKKYKKQYISG